MAKLVHKAVIPDDYKFILETTTVQCEAANLPTLPTFRDNASDKLMLVASSTTKPGLKYVCNKDIIYKFSSAITKSVNTSSYEINIPMTINDSKWTNNFRFVRFSVCIDGLKIENEFEDTLDVYFNISLKFGDIAAISKATLIETIKQGGNLSFFYFYDFIYDTRLNSLSFEKRSF